MFNSFSSALAALKAHSSAVDTIGHNLANVNTTGFKAVESRSRIWLPNRWAGQPEIGMGVGSRSPSVTSPKAPSRQVPAP